MKKYTNNPILIVLAIALDIWFAIAVHMTLANFVFFAVVIGVSAYAAQRRTKGKK